MPDTGHPVLLIHGAWQGAWVWDGLLPVLAEAGHRPLAIDLPGNGTDATPPETVTFGDHLAAGASALASFDAPAVIVAHSGGGVLATALAETNPDRVSALVYVAGMMLPSGMTFPEFTAPFVARDPKFLGISTHLEAMPNASAVPPGAATDIFYHDVPAEAARAAAGRLTPQGEAVRAPRVHWTAGRAGRVCRHYIRCGKDRSVLPDVQDEMLRRWPGATVATLDCGHAPMLAAPESLSAELLRRLAERPAAVKVSHK